MNSDLEKLQPYPFEKMAGLHAGITPPEQKSIITLAIGEPKHSPPGFIAEEIITHLHGLSHYPLTRGTAGLREAIKTWLSRRFSIQASYLDIDRHILPVNGTREALFAFAQAMIDRNKKPHILMPNPFYQIYEGAAFLAGATPVFYNTTRETGYLPDFDAISEADWQQCQLLYICTPGNPTGTVIPKDQLKSLIEKAEKYDFIIASDECYSEIYFDENTRPPGLLEAAKEMGNDEFKRCIVFHSLSKRSNLPGLRSGFVAGDAGIIQSFLQYRTYHGCAMPPPTQAASISAWSDEQHVIDNRLLYKTKFNAVVEILSPVLDVTLPDAGFYLWTQTPVIDTDFARNLFAEQNVTVLPGQFLSRSNKDINPGENHIRMALVATVDETVDAARRIHQFVENL